MIKASLFIFSFIIIQANGSKRCNPVTLQGQICSSFCNERICEVNLDNETTVEEECMGTIKCSENHDKFNEMRRIARVKETNETCMTPCIQKYLNDPSTYCLIGRQKNNVTGYEKLCYETDEEARVYFTSGHNQKLESTCVGECAKAGLNYNWCFVNSSTATNDWKLDWDRCSREYGKSSSGKICQSPCESNQYFEYSCKMRFQKYKVVNMACSPVKIDKPTSSHMVSKVDNILGLGQEICATPCNHGVCGVPTPAPDRHTAFTNCTPTDQLRNLYFSGESEDQSARCNGECIYDGIEAFCFNVDTAKDRHCSLSDRISAWKVQKCLTECEFNPESRRHQCFTKIGYTYCSPKPINKTLAYEFHQREIFAQPEVEPFGIWFKKLKEIFHVKPVKNANKGGGDVTYYIDYIDGVPIVKGLQVNVSRTFILSKPIDWYYEQNKNNKFHHRYMSLQYLQTDLKEALLHPGLGGSLTEELNMVPVFRGSYTLDDVASKLVNDITDDDEIDTIDYKVVPLYTFDAHRPYGFMIVVTYEFHDQTFYIQVEKVIESELLSLITYEPDYENQTVKHDEKFVFLNKCVIVVGFLATGMLLIMCLKNKIRYLLSEDKKLSTSQTVFKI